MFADREPRTTLSLYEGAIRGAFTILCVAIFKEKVEHEPLQATAGSQVLLRNYHRALVVHSTDHSVCRDSRQDGAVRAAGYVMFSRQQ